jgi:hypothetical protein
MRAIGMKKSLVFYRGRAPHGFEQTGLCMNIISTRRNVKPRHLCWYVGFIDEGMRSLGICAGTSVLLICFCLFVRNQRTEIQKKKYKRYNQLKINEPLRGTSKKDITIS